MITRDTEDWKFDYEYPRRRGRNGSYYWQTWSAWSCKYCGKSKTREGLEPPKCKCECRKVAKVK